MLAETEFDLAAVRLLDGPFKKAQELDQMFLLRQDANRLLLSFKITAGIASWAKPIGGYESPGCELRGHAVGHYLSACALMYASTGDPALKAKCDAIVEGFAKCQANAPKQGYHAGYLSAFPESLFDRVDALQRVWAPWYTMHKILAGLVDAHVHTASVEALAIAQRLADWVKFRVDRLTPEQMQASLKEEHGGMNEALCNLYAVTHNPDHLRLALAFNQKLVFEPLSKGEDHLNGLHANTQIPKIVGAAREYELGGDETFRRAAEFFWKRVALSRSYANGGNSDEEHFFPVTDFAKHLTPVTAETCNTYNMLKLTRHVFAWEPKASTMDFYERALYNHILASQDPRTGLFCYYISFKPGHFKVYSSPDESFWCCVGTGMENHARYGEAIYAHGSDSLYINLFIASELTWAERGLVLRQETQFPEEAATQFRLKLKQPSKFALKLRHPAWCTEGMSVSVNGASTPAEPDSTGYITLDREWRDGDLVQLQLPMTLRTEPLPGEPRTVAFFYGPILLAGALGDAGMPENGAYATRDAEKFSEWPVPTVPALTGDPAGILATLQPVAGKPLTFAFPKKSKDDDPLTFIPLYRLHHQRYNVYWPLGTN